MAVVEEKTTTTTITDDTTSSMYSINPKNYSREGQMLGSSVGIIIGLRYAFKTKSGFLKGFGYFLLGSLVVGGLGYGVGSVIKKKKS